MLIAASHHHKPIHPQSVIAYCKSAGRSSLFHSCAWNCTMGSRKKRAFRTNRTSAAFVWRRYSCFCCSSAVNPSFRAGSSTALASSALRASIVLSRTLCILERTFTVARASGKSVAEMLSGDTQDAVDWRLSPAAETASRRRATVKAANISPVPLKKQSKAGTSIRNKRGDPSHLVVDPMTVRKFSGGVGVPPDWESLDSCTEVIMT